MMIKDVIEISTRWSVNISVLRAGYLWKGAKS
jgi:hypothetical protein